MMVLFGTELLNTVRFQGSSPTRHSPVVKLTASMGDRWALLAMFFIVEMASPGLVAGMAACTGIRTVIELKKPHLHLRFRNRL